MTRQPRPSFGAKLSFGAKRLFGAKPSFGASRRTQLNEDAAMSTLKHFKGFPLAARCTVVLFSIGGLAALLYAVTFQREFVPDRLLLLLALAAGSARIKVNLFKGS